MSWWDMFRAGADVDRSDSITPEEFSALFSQMEESPNKIAEAAGTAFDVLDGDGDGMIDLDEYQAFRSIYGLDNANAAEHFARFDADGDSAISRSEFETLLVDFLVSDDPETPGSLLFGEL